MWKFVRACLTALLVAAAGGLAYAAVDGNPDDSPLMTRPGVIPIGVIGDSDSHAYHDQLWFGDDPSLRGGVYRDSTYNWPELLAKLRGDQIDPGEWGVWGVSRWFGLVRDHLGLPTRLPRKQDHRYNMAYSGAGCHSAIYGSKRQAPRLVAMMDEQPEYWRKGVVLIRIGVNDFSTVEHLDQLAANPDDAQVRSIMDTCVHELETTVDLIRLHHPQTAIVLVGIFNNAHWPRAFEHWQSPAQLANIDRGLDRFDEALRRIAARVPRVAFWDDRAWFDQRWGSRGADGKPVYRDVVLNGLVVHNTLGDDPSNSTVVDGHAGTVFNALWAQSFIELVNQQFDAHIRPLTTEEIVGLIEPADERVSSSSN